MESLFFFGKDEYVTVVLKGDSVEPPRQIIGLVQETNAVGIHLNTEPSYSGYLGVVLPWSAIQLIFKYDSPTDVNDTGSWYEAATEGWQEGKGLEEIHEEHQDSD